ncbi:hypothetical protein [Yinghuangia seranimata]|uniref:hypothetical protein n=1 Tax=Yinghuangia seranimata TaxID=408067 RepID=UPI00248C8668|nr:hypothetical protein [Yinghuangia seranimata]MDI2125527.1 hypothetical protein [Yinghuangia seranimata]
MHLDDLLRNATPAPDREPALPVPTDWRAVERWLGTQLPVAYRRVAEVWGPVELGGALEIAVPCHGEYFDYGQWLRECSSPEAGLLFWPDEGGLLAWGRLRDHTLFWDTSVSADPDAWTVVSWMPSDRSQPNAVHDFGLTTAEFLDAVTSPEYGHQNSPRPVSATIRRTRYRSDVSAWPVPDLPARERHADRRAAFREGAGWDTLVRLVPPPEQPRLDDGVTWDSVFTRLGTRLPAEYVTLIERYGRGHWRETLNFVDPFRTDAGGLFWEIHRLTELCGILREDDPDAQLPSLWPAPGGFLPFAVTVGVDTVGWWTVGKPDAWPLGVLNRELDHEYPPLHATLVDTLLAWCRGTYDDQGFWTLHDDDPPPTEDELFHAAEFTP